MVVDSSALVAIILHEAEGELFADLILRQPLAVMSVASVLETSISLLAKRRDVDSERLNDILATLAIEERSVDAQQGAVARQAFSRFGRGRHPAALNFGDCFAYALARVRDEPLLFKGNDFVKTDIVPAWKR